MSGELDIRGGGAVAVDTATLHSAASGFDAVAVEIAEIRDRIGALQNTLFFSSGYALRCLDALRVLDAHCAASAARGVVIGDNLRAAAAVYELVELDAARAAAVAAGDAVEIGRLEAMRQAIVAEYPDAPGLAMLATTERTLLWPGAIVRQATEGGHDLGDLFEKSGAMKGRPEMLGTVVGGVALGGAAIGGAILVGVGGWGRVPRDTVLKGSGPPVTLTAKRAPVTAAPGSLTAAGQRIPSGQGSQVRVEKYTMADGSRRFAVYVSGTKTLAAVGDEPWDSRSNAELYTGHRSASYEATEQALRAAGAQPGDIVHAFGHSQGAMITAHLALEGDYDTRSLVSFGSPVEADVAESTLSVGIRHTDDPVAALAGGGHMESVGASGSFVAEREAHPAADMEDLALRAHLMESYLETAELVDDSGDPRVAAWETVVDELNQAVSVEATEFTATRVTAGPGSVSASSPAVAR
ncbi:hypothetical protein [Microbacterium sp. C7(2022)]|uniref:hypothetical protein n=1 Tax=Microbacterium sp. C7(2022) TaxID=2992759 RepID=UPI00237B56ED|nr:hypothetical protein [Microbacterium sp. C7(2022)]MDE0546379.1 hypothetical protein [Microbacterium sp. C7(2022)]